MATGILCHGYNLHAEGWESVVWGEPPHKLGRATKAFLEFLECNDTDSRIVFGTGATKKDGRFEGEYIRDFLLKNVERLREFSAFDKRRRRHGEHGEISHSERAWRYAIERNSSAETTSHNTRGEIRAAADIFLKARMDRMVLVSSPTHLPRCLRDACAIFTGSPFEYRSLFAGFRAVPSQTLHPNTVMSDVEIKEPPHIPKGSKVVSRTGCVDQDGQPKPGQSGYNIYPEDHHGDTSIDSQDWDRNAYYYYGKRYIYGTGGPNG